MKLLGIDPGLRISGFGIISRESGHCFLLDYGFLKMTPTQTLVERVGQFYDFFSQKIKEVGITAIALETPFMGKNAQNFLKLGYLRGIIYLLANQYSLQVFEFAPSEVKRALTGFGSAEKEQVARVVMRLFPQMVMPKTYDVTDAVAVSLCGMWRSLQPVSTTVFTR